MNVSGEERTWEQLPLREAYPFGIDHGLENEISAIREMSIEWDRPYTASLRRGFIVELFDNKGLLQSFKDTCWPNGNTPDGERRLRRYRRIRQQYDSFLSGTAITGEDETLEGETLSEQEFAYESDLRDFLAKNLSIIEPGLELFQDQATDGVEYSIEGGRIDILARDQQGRFVVIELKVSRGRNRTIGQLLYYMGWVDTRLTNSGTCRGVIVAKDISNDLRIACERVPDVSLYRYVLSVAVEKVYPL